MSMTQSYRIFRNSPLAFHLSTIETTTKTLAPFLSFSFVLRWSYLAGCWRLPIQIQNIFIGFFSWRKNETPTRSQVFWVSSSFALGVKENGSLIFSLQRSIAVRFVKQERFLKTKKALRCVWDWRNRSVVLRFSKDSDWNLKNSSKYFLEV